MTIRTLDELRALLTTMGVAALCMTISPQSNAAEIQVGRYSTQPLMATAAQADLLSTTITLTFPARVYTVGEAVQYLLQRSGYRLAAEAVIEPATADLLALPLPAVHRSLGPMTLMQALETLAGPVFHLIHDPVHRLISFELCRSLEHAVPQEDSSLKSEVSQDGE